jgi:hypothetical protein
MSTVDAAARTITYRIAYFGPGLCGKTTNLTAMHALTAPDRRGQLRSIATDTERTLSVVLGIDAEPSPPRLTAFVVLVTVPGPVFYDASRKLILRGADGVIFVADSQEMRREANVESMENLCANLEANGVDPAAIPMVLQYNKRDLPDVASIATLDQELNPRGLPRYEGIANRNVGVRETFEACISLIARAASS